MLKVTSFLYIFIIRLLFHEIGAAQNPLQTKIVFFSMDCSKHSAKLKYFHCSNEFVNGVSRLNLFTESVVDFKVVVAKVIINLAQSGGRKEELLNMAINVCDILQHNPRRNLLAKLYKPIVQAYYNFPKKCPFKKNTRVGIKNYTSDALTWRAFLPELNFTTSITISEGVDKALSILIKGAVCRTQRHCQRYMNESAANAF